jgi:hypothetical protein
MAQIHRGDVLIARVVESGRTKFRFVVVVQNDKNNQR